MEYQQIAAAGSSPAPSTDALLRVSWNGAGGVISGLVFGTLLGPEATGPRPAGRVASLRGGCAGAGCGTAVSGFLAAPITRLVPLRGRVWGVWYGVVV